MRLVKTSSIPVRAKIGTRAEENVIWIEKNQTLAFPNIDLNNISL